MIGGKAGKDINGFLIEKEEEKEKEKEGERGGGTYQASV